MSIDLLDGVREKLIRAREHLDTLESDLTTYEAGGSYGVVRQFEDHIPEKTGRPGLTWRARVDPPPPIRLSIIAGDCLHNLRSALDHLAWALVLHNGGEPSDSGDKTQFPILLTPHTSKTGAVVPITIRARKGSAGSAAETILDMLQPYNGGNDPALHPLWVLCNLSNTDKHRILNLVAMDFGHMILKGGGIRVSAVRRDVEDGTMITWRLAEHPDYDPKMELDVEFAPSIAFQEARGVGADPVVPAAQLLAELLMFTRESVVQRFARACFGGELTF